MKSAKSIEPGKFRQFMAAFIANLAALSYGIMVGWQSPMQPLLQSANPPVGTEPMTDEAASWLSGIMCLAGTLTSLTIGPLTARFGRKPIGCFLAVPLCVSWLLVIFASQQTHIFIGRFFSGIAGGSALFLVPLYVSEISCDEIRGMLGSLLVFFLNIGILLAYILGAFLSFRTFAIVSLALPLVYLACFLFLPESPVYLVRRNRLRQAARSLMWLKAGHKHAVEREISHLQIEVKEASDTARSFKLSDLFRDRATMRGLIVTMGLFGGQQLGGIFAMISYTESIFSISGSSLSPNVSAMAVGAMQVFGSYLSTSLMERMGRRALLLISCMGMCLGHYTLGTFCYLRVLELDVAAFRWVPVAALSLYIITYCLGMGPGPYVITSEIFSRDVSSLATTVGLFFVWSMAFVVVKTFPTFVGLLGMHGCFFLLGTFCLASFVFTFFLVPETKGRPRQEIIDELNGLSPAPVEKQYVCAKGSTTDSKDPPLPEQV